MPADTVDAVGGTTLAVYDWAAADAPLRVSVATALPARVTVAVAVVVSEVIFVLVMAPLTVLAQVIVVRVAIPSAADSGMLTVPIPPILSERSA